MTAWLAILPKKQSEQIKRFLRQPHTLLGLVERQLQYTQAIFFSDLFQTPRFAQMFAIAVFDPSPLLDFDTCSGTPHNICIAITYLASLFQGNISEIIRICSGDSGFFFGLFSI